MRNRLVFSIFLSFSIGTCFPLMDPFYWLLESPSGCCLHWAPSGSWLQALWSKNGTLFSMICETCCHGHYYAVTSVQLLVSLTAKYEWGNAESLVSLRQPHHPFTSMVASCATNVGNMWHYRKGIHKALQPWKPLMKHHMASIWGRPHTLQYLWHLLHVLPVTALPCWLWYRRWSWKISPYFYNNTTVIHILINILRLHHRKRTGHWTSKSQMAEAQFLQKIRRF